jgi:subtilisin family serine protease
VPTICVAFLAAQVAAVLAGSPAPARFSPDTILVKPKPGADLNALHASLGTTVLRAFPRIGNLEIVQLPQNACVTNFLALFLQSGQVQYAEPDYIVHSLNAPNDTYYLQTCNGLSTLWGLNTIYAPLAWDTRTDGSSLVVATTDTGVDYNHPDLNDTVHGINNLWTDGQGHYGVKSIQGVVSYDPMDDLNPGYHGTHVSGIIGAVGNNGIGVVGVCWRARTMTCKFLNSSGQGFVSDAIYCIDYAINNNAKIINASWGDYMSPPYAGDNGAQILQDPSLLDPSYGPGGLHDAIASARAAGVIFVAACGNSASNNDDPTRQLYPACYSDLDNIIAVAATDSGDQLAAFSNYGATKVHVGAPGLDIWSCDHGSYCPCWQPNPPCTSGQYQNAFGTSMATPYVAGACALVWAQYPNDSYQSIINRVLTAVDPVPALAGKCKTGGRLNLVRALTANGDGTWATTGNLNTARDYQAATLLPSGVVLASGGYDGTAALYSAELFVYNQATGIGTWTATANTMTVARFKDSATLLPDGTVLVAGGLDASSTPLSSAEIFTYDPATGNGTWSAIANQMHDARYSHTATLLPGAATVLVAGGIAPLHGAYAGCELYANGTWTVTGSMNIPRYLHTATLLANGKVLVAGGYTGARFPHEEIYDPATGSWTTTNPLNTQRSYHTATLLTSGKVLIAGGRASVGSTILSSAELYDPSTGIWSSAGTMTSARYFHTATLLPNGKVLVTGGDNSGGAVNTTELYDPAGNSWAGANSMSTARAVHTATLLPGGKVLAAGGANTTYLKSAELYNTKRF